MSACDQVPGATGTAHPGAAAPGRLDLPARPSSVHDARAFVLDRCRDAGASEDCRDTAVLLTSEVVTNAILHGRSETRLEVAVTPAVVRVEVGDDNSRHPVPADPDSGALDGRGMAIVDLLATAWGVRDTTYGKVVWFEVPTA